MTIEELNAQAERILDEVERAVVGKREALELILLGLLADGHVLIEDRIRAGRRRRSPGGARSRRGSLGACAPRTAQSMTKPTVIAETRPFRRKKSVTRRPGSSLPTRQ